MAELLILLYAEAQGMCSSALEHWGACSGIGIGLLQCNTEMTYTVFTLCMDVECISILYVDICGYAKLNMYIILSIYIIVHRYISISY